MHIRGLAHEKLPHIDALIMRALAVKHRLGLGALMLSACLAGPAVVGAVVAVLS